MAIARSSLQSPAHQKWVSGRTYGADAIVWSPISDLYYRRIVAGAGTTDPSADPANWKLHGPTRRKGLQYVNVTLVAGTGQPIATATIPQAVIAANCRLRIIWGTQAASVWLGPAVPTVTAPTTLSVDFGGSATGSNIVVRVEIDEDW